MANRYIKLSERLRAGGLLDMMYSPEDLEWETGIEPRRMREVLPRIGMPHVRDAAGRMWIRGVEFSAWVKVFDKKNKVPLAEGEAYCLRCNKPVPLLNPIRVKGYATVLLQAKCPVCGATVNRAVRALEGGQKEQTRRKEAKALTSGTMINRENYLVVRAFLDYRSEVLQLDPRSVKVAFTWLKHLLRWAGETTITDVARMRPVFPQYLLTTKRADGKGDETLSRNAIGEACEYARGLFAWAREHEPTRFGAISLGWIETLRPPRMGDVPPKTREFITLEMVRAALAVADGDDVTRRDQAALAFLFLSGMRATAFCSLTVECVDADQGRVLQYPHMGVKTKNRKAARTVLYDIPDLRAVVREWHAERLAEGPKALWYPAIGVGAKEEFIESRTDALRYGLKRLSALAGIPYMSPHKARHGHAVYGLKLARNMAEYKAVSQNLMHSTIGITDSIYAVLSDEDVREQIAGLGKGGAAPEAARVDEIVRLILSRVG